MSGSQRLSLPGLFPARARRSSSSPHRAFAYDGPDEGKDKNKTKSQPVAKKPANPERPPTPDAEAAALAFVRENHPELAGPAQAAQADEAGRVRTGRPRAGAGQQEPGRAQGAKPAGLRARPECVEGQVAGRAADCQARQRLSARAPSWKASSARPSRTSSISRSASRSSSATRSRNGSRSSRKTSTAWNPAATLSSSRAIQTFVKKGQRARQQNAERRRLQTEGETESADSTSEGQHQREKCRSRRDHHEGGTPAMNRPFSFAATRRCCSCCRRPPGRTRKALPPYCAPRASGTPPTTARKSPTSSGTSSRSWAGWAATSAVVPRLVPGPGRLPPLALRLRLQDRPRCPLRQGRSRRVDRETPEGSKILQKPTLAIPHKGGKRMEEDTWQYRLLVRWIEAGAKGVEKPVALRAARSDPGRDRLRARGPERPAQGRRPLGRRHAPRTSPASAAIRTNDESIAEIDANGVVTSKGKGDTHVVAFYDNGVAVTQVILPVSDKVGPNYPDVPTPTRIDELVVAKLRKLGIVPSEVCTDAEFLRRVSLDLTGTLPAPARGRGVPRRLRRPPSARRRSTSCSTGRPMPPGGRPSSATSPATASAASSGPAGPCPSRSTRHWYEWLERRVRRERALRQAHRGHRARHQPQAGPELRGVLQGAEPLLPRQRPGRLLDARDDALLLDQAHTRTSPRRRR